MNFLLGREVSEESEAKRSVKGYVKWFDPGKGFGFVVSDDGGADILLHANVLRNFGQSSVADRTRIEVVVQRTDRGVQATEVLSIAAPPRADMAVLADLADLDPAEIEAAPFQPARVKWFDKSKGFGFVNIFRSREDVFVHIEVVRQAGLADLQPGEALAVKTVEGKRGLMATEVCGWDSAIKN